MTLFPLSKIDSDTFETKIGSTTKFQTTVSNKFQTTVTKKVGNTGQRRG